MLLAFNSELLITGIGTLMVIAGVLLAAWAIRARTHDGHRPRRRILKVITGNLLTVIGLYIALKSYIESSGWAQWVQNALGWILPLVGTTLMVIGGTVFLWCLFADRSRGRKRCPRCWYDMAAIPALTCPECGKVAKTERAQHRTRRYYRRAALGLLLALLGSAQFAEPWYRRGGLTRIAPTRILIMFMPSASPSSYLLGQLRQRLLAQPTRASFSGYELPGVKPMSEGTRTQFVRTSLGALKGNPTTNARDLMWEVLPWALRKEDAQVAEPLVLAALADKSEIVRLSAITTLRKVEGFDNEKGVTAVLGMLNAAAMTVSAGSSMREAIGYLGEHGDDPRAVAALVSELQSPSFRAVSFGPGDAMWTETLHALATVGPAAKESLPAITAASRLHAQRWGRSSLEPIARYAAALIRGDSGGRVAVLNAMLADPEEESRFFAVRELATMPGAESAAALDKALRDTRPLVRISAAAALLAQQPGHSTAFETLSEEMRTIDLEPTTVDYQRLPTLIDAVFASGLSPEPLESRFKAMAKRRENNPTDEEANLASQWLRELESRRRAAALRR